MLLKLSVCPFRRANRELMAQDLKDQILGKRLGALFALVAVTGRLGRRHLDAEDSALLGHGLEDILGGDDVENEARVPDDDTLDTDSSHTRTPDYLDVSTMKVGGAQLGGGTLTTGVQLGA